MTTIHSPLSPPPCSLFRSSPSIRRRPLCSSQVEQRQDGAHRAVRRLRHRHDHLVFRLRPDAEPLQQMISVAEIDARPASRFLNRIKKVHFVEKKVKEEDGRSLTTRFWNWLIASSANYTAARGWLSIVRGRRRGCCCWGGAGARGMQGSGFSTHFGLGGAPHAIAAPNAPEDLLAAAAVTTTWNVVTSPPSGIFNSVITNRTKRSVIIGSSRGTASGIGGGSLDVASGARGGRGGGERADPLHPANRRRTLEQLGVVEQLPRVNQLHVGCCPRPLLGP